MNDVTIQAVDLENGQKQGFTVDVVDEKGMIARFWVSVKLDSKNHPVMSMTTKVGPELKTEKQHKMVGYHNISPRHVEIPVGKPYEVAFQSQHVTTVYFIDGVDNLRDLVMDIDVPETKECKYVGNSFEILSVLDENFNEVELPEDDEDEIRRRDEKHGLYPQYEDPAN